MRIFFQNNLDIIFFIYGLAFVIMGLAIIIQPRRGSSFKIATVLYFLGGFGITHGINEWLDMWVIIKASGTPILWLGILRWVVLVVSYVFLVEFGRRFIVISRENKKTTSFLGVRLTVVLTAIGLAMAVLSGDFLHKGGIWLRYFIGLPGGILTSLGLVSYYRNIIRKDLPGLRSNFYCSALFFFVYALTSGLVVPRADFFPASLINTQTFMDIFGGIPVQLIRAICAVFISVFIGRILTMFRWETIKNLCAIEKERFADKVTSSTEEMIMVIDKDFRIKWANKKVKSAYGQDILGQYCYAVTHHSDVPCHPPDDTCPVEESINSKKSATVIHKHFDKKGNVLYSEVSVYPLLDEEGKNAGDFIHVSRDVTDRIKGQKELEDAYTELKAIQEKLLAAEKMASLGKLSAGIAHEINNPIGYVVSNLSSLDKYLSSLAPLLERYAVLEEELLNKCVEGVGGHCKDIKEIKERIDYSYLIADIPKLIRETADGAQRVVRIVRDLKSFARQDEVEFKEANLTELIETSLNIVWNEVKYKADVYKDYGDIPAIYCHPQQITQVVMNIVVNAAQAIEGHGKIFIKTYFKDAKAYIEINDTGKGMTPDVMEKIFEPFFTTKKIGEGTGLGLAIVYGIIQKHKGSIEVSSIPGEGSTFIISLPVNAPKTSGK